MGHHNGAHGVRSFPCNSSDLSSRKRIIDASEIVKSRPDGGRFNSKSTVAVTGRPCRFSCAENELVQGQRAMSSNRMVKNLETRKYRPARYDVDKSSIWPVIGHCWWFSGANNGLLASTTSDGLWTGRPMIRGENNIDLPAGKPVVIPMGATVAKGVIVTGSMQLLGIRSEFSF